MTPGLPRLVPRRLSSLGLPANIRHEAAPRLFCKPAVVFNKQPGQALWDLRRATPRMFKVVSDYDCGYINSKAENGITAWTPQMKLEDTTTVWAAGACRYIDSRVIIFHVEQ